MSEDRAAHVRQFCGDCGGAVDAGAETCAACGSVLRSVAPAPLAVEGPDSTRAGGLPVDGRLGLVAVLGFFLALVYAFHYIGRSH